MKIDYPHRIQPLRQLWQTVFGDSDAFLDLFFDTAYTREHCRCVTLEGKLAGALHWLDMEYAGGKLAYIYAVATDPAFRGRGVCRKLMEDTHALLKETGYAGAVLVPQEPGLFRMYEKMGYRPGSGIREFRAVSGESAVPLKKVDPATYQTLRHQMLKPEDIRLGNRALAFLRRQASFYAGEDLLLAAVREEEKLRCLELLGPEEAAPGILNALGCREGIFRTPGDRPFSMFLPLKGDLPNPGHLGFAFD